MLPITLIYAGLTAVFYFGIVSSVCLSVCCLVGLVVVGLLVDSG